MDSQLYDRVKSKLQLDRGQMSYVKQKNKAITFIWLHYDFIYILYKCTRAGTHTRIHTRIRDGATLHSYLLKALLISEELDALQQLEVVLLKEAVEGGLHVPELGEEPASHSGTALRSAFSLWWVSLL